MAKMNQSLPLWECGLKFLKKNCFLTDGYVTPLVGVRIEIYCRCELRLMRFVTPLVGVWIEITLGMNTTG